MPAERALYESLAQGRTLVRYDKAGCGLSGVMAQAPSMELELETLDAVVRAVGDTRFDLFGASLGAAVAAAWTARHPDRVARLVLYGGWVRGADIATPQVREHVLGLITEHWALARTCSPTSSPPTPMRRPGPPSSATSARPRRQPSRAGCSPSPTTSTSPT